MLGNATLRAPNLALDQQQLMKHVTRKKQAVPLFHHSQCEAVAKHGPAGSQSQELEL
jgi:hypothetical protein